MNKYPPHLEIKYWTDIELERTLSEIQEEIIKRRADHIENFITHHNRVKLWQKQSKTSP